jgi:hypothetical protein
LLASAEDARAWWEKHKDKSLLEMQVMVVDWIIGQGAERPAEFTDSEREYLKEFRDRLIGSQKPEKRGNYYSADREFRVRSSDRTTSRIQQGSSDEREADHVSRVMSCRLQWCPVSVLGRADDAGDDRSVAHRRPPASVGGGDRVTPHTLILGVVGGQDVHSQYD